MCISCPRSINTKTRKKTKSTDQSNIRHTNNSDGKTKVKSINFSKKIYDYSNL